MSTTASPSSQAAAIVAGDRRQLARAITLMESTRPDHRLKAEQLVAELIPHTGNSVRIGITGVPGVGKSTFIEAFGLHLLEEGHKVCVLAVDPSSQKTGGSILGDKTRMEALSKQPNAFIRPSPSGKTLGGVARRTREAVLACEAAGFDIVLIETVGVGQSETAVADLVDMFLLLIAPAGGDELQGIKKGIVELADLIVVNKADGDLMPAAERAKRDYGAALHLLRASSENWQPKIHLCSSLNSAGINDISNSVDNFEEVKKSCSEFQDRRAAQASVWMWNEVHETLNDQLQSAPHVAELIPVLEAEVRSGKTTPSDAARRILTTFKN